MKAQFPHDCCNKWGHFLSDQDDCRDHNNFVETINIQKNSMSKSGVSDFSEQEKFKINGKWSLLFVSLENTYTKTHGYGHMDIQTRTPG